MAFPTDKTVAVDGVTEIIAAHLNHLEDKVGINNSADPNSLDYQVFHHDHQAPVGVKLDHGLALSGLTDDDHTQYALLAGRIDDALIFKSTSYAHKFVHQESYDALSLINKTPNATSMLLIGPDGDVVNKMGSVLWLFRNNGIADPDNLEGLVIQAGSTCFDSEDYFIGPDSYGTGVDRILWLYGKEPAFQRVLGIISAMGAAYAKFLRNVAFGDVIPESAIDVRNAYIVQAGTGGIRTYGTGSHALAGAYAGIDFAHNGAHAMLRSFAGGGSSYSDLELFVGPSSFSQGLLIRREADTSNTVNIVGADSDGLRIRTDVSGANYYKIGRNQTTGFLDLYGTQATYNGYKFTGVDGGYVLITGTGKVGVKMTPTYTLDITGNLRCSTGFGCNGTTPQTAYASGGAAGAVAGTATSGGYGFVDAAEMNAFITAVNVIKDLANNIRSALVADGIMS